MTFILGLLLVWLLFSAGATILLAVVLSGSNTVTLPEDEE
jgi:hypothetical protein